MRSIRQLCLSSLMAALLGASSAYGDGSAIELQTSVEKRVQRILDSGQVETLFEPAGTVVPGDTIAYRIEARNISSDQPAENVVITDPIPEHTQYLSGSAAGEGARVFFSVDGGMRFDAPEALRVVDEGVSRVATASDYTHIRWVFSDSLAPSETRAVHFFAQLQ